MAVYETPPSIRAPHIGGLNGIGTQLAIHDVRRQISFAMRRLGDFSVDITEPYVLFTDHANITPENTYGMKIRGLGARLTSPEQLDRLRGALTCAIIGPAERRASQRASYRSLLSRLASSEITLPIGVLSGPDGGTSRAKQVIQTIEKTRDRWAIQESAPAVLVYGEVRQGQDPDAWLRTSKEMIERHEGQIMLNLTGSTEHQQQDHVQALTELGYSWVGNVVLLGQSTIDITETKV